MRRTERPTVRRDYIRMNEDGLMSTESEDEEVLFSREPQVAKMSGASPTKPTHEEDVEPKEEVPADIEAALEEEVQRQQLLEDQLKVKKKGLKLLEIRRKNRELEAEINRVSEESAAEEKMASMPTSMGPAERTQTIDKPLKKPRKRKGKSSAAEPNPAVSWPLNVQSLRADDVLQAGAEQLLSGLSLPGGESSALESCDSQEFSGTDAATVGRTREYKSCTLKQNVSQKGHVRVPNHNVHFQGVNPNSILQQCSRKAPVQRDDSSSDSEFSNAKIVRNGLLKGCQQVNTNVSKGRSQTKNNDSRSDCKCKCDTGGKKADLKRPSRCQV